MLQVIQYQKSGEISIENLPAPQLKRGGILVRNHFSLISAGTERSSVTTAQASLIGKARSRPDLVRQVMNNVKREGLLATIEKVQNRLDNFKELGYSCAGVVAESATEEFKVGDRVACGGVGYASHAEYVFVPGNLAVLVPEQVSLGEAAYSTVASIAMQGVRRADLRVGERVVVLGLGLIGLLTVQLLKASGCFVIGLDVSDRNFELARALGCDECAISDHASISRVEDFTNGYGSDAVLITAATTSNEPVEFAMQYARKRSKVVVVGTVGMDIPRNPFYEKELDFRISCSYGPGRYDPEYEEGGNDYPIGYVRWTEKRNMGSVLDLMAAGKLDVRTLTTHTFDIGQSLDAYDIVTGKTRAYHIGILIQYPEGTEPANEIRRRVQFSAARSAPAGQPVLGFIGAGNHTQSYLIPPLMKLSATLETVVTSKPVNAMSVAKKFGFRAFATDAKEVLSDPNINLVFVNTRHDSHGRYVLDTLRAGKGIFVEKPLTIEPNELEEIATLYEAASRQGSAPFVMVGYNRRFSDAMQTVKEFMSKTNEPLVMTYRVNAGFLPASSWYQGSEQGGRIIGEGCHFVDTMQFLSGSLPVSVFATAPADSNNRYNNDNVSVEIAFADGSVGHILYVANGASSMPKEYFEVFGGGRSATMDNFKTVTLYDGGRKRSQSFSGDKGHASEMKAVFDGIHRGESPIPFFSLVATSRATFSILDSLRSRARVDIE